MADICTDNRFELINEAKKRLLEYTNIEDSPDEMAVLENMLFRFWQIGWLDHIHDAFGTCKCVDVTPNDWDEDLTMYHMECGFTMLHGEDKPRFCGGFGKRIKEESE